MGEWGQTKIKDHLYPAKAGSGADLDTFPTFPAVWVGGWVGGCSPAQLERRWSVTLLSLYL